MKCGGCDKEYIGEAAMTLGVWFKEHTDDKHPNPAVTEHTATTGHKYTFADVKVLVKEDGEFKRNVREVAIQKNKPDLN